VWNKVREEIAELEHATADADADAIESEVGDVLFSIVNYCRFIKVNPEDALRRTIQKFDRRFRHVERRLREQGRAPSDATLEEMDRYWDEAKRAE
jgi:uncharacterized protein YabN with tetrapyrrole methylase and pyrophosphatase domain